MTLPGRRVWTPLILVAMTGSAAFAQSQPSPRPRFLPGAGACTLTCPSDVAVSNAAGQCSATVNYPAPTTVGSCGTITCTPPTNGTFAVGPTLVTCQETAGATNQTSVYSSGNIAVPIPASGSAGLMTPQTINIPDPGTVVDVNLRIRANHTFDADLEVSLTGPNGVPTVLVMDDNGASGDNLGTGGTDCSGTKTIFDDEAGTSIAAGAAPFAGSFTPLNPLSGLDGQAAAGTWTLSINDDLAGDTGSLFCWDLEVTRLVPIVGETCGFTVTVNDTEPPTLTCPADISVLAPQGQNTVPVNFPVLVAADNCAIQTESCVPPSGSQFPIGSTAVNCSALDAASNTGICDFDVVVQGQSVVEVPTLSWTGLAGLVALLAVAAFVVLRRGS